MRHISLFEYLAASEPPPILYHSSSDTTREGIASQGLVPNELAGESYVWLIEHPDWSYGDDIYSVSTVGLEGLEPDGGGQGYWKSRLPIPPSNIKLLKEKVDYFWCPFCGELDMMTTDSCPHCGQQHDDEYFEFAKP